MDYNEVLINAKKNIGPNCKVCTECNGLACGNLMPGPGSKAPGNGANDNWKAWRGIKLNMDTIVPDAPVDTGIEFLGKPLSMPLISAPVGSLKAQYNPTDDIRDFNVCCAEAAERCGIASSFGDGLDARVFPHGCEVSKAHGGIAIPVINPLNMETIMANLDTANAAMPFAVSVVVDSAGLPHLKKISPDAGSKSVEQLSELCKYAKMPVIIKGVMTAQSALKAVDAGAAAIIVSNHGGRVLAGTPATAEVLPEIAAALKGTGVKVLVDGGIRTGVDVFKALALGADGVLICRPFVTAVYGGGAEGVKCYIDKLAGELADTMQMCGAHTLAEITPDMVRV